MTEPKSPSTVAADHANSFAVGDPVDYSGAALGNLRGVIAKVLDLADASGHRLKTFLIGIDGYVERIHTSADALTKVDTSKKPAPSGKRARKPAQPQSIEIPRSAYADTTVPPLTDDRTADEPGSTAGGFDEPDTA